MERRLSEEARFPNFLSLGFSGGASKQVIFFHHRKHQFKGDPFASRA